MSLLSFEGFLGLGELLLEFVILLLAILHHLILLLLKCRNLLRGLAQLRLNALYLEILGGDRSL